MQLSQYDKFLKYQMHEVIRDSYVPKADLLLLIFILLIYLGACGTIHLSEAFLSHFFLLVCHGFPLGL